MLGNGKALRYGIGVGREGFTWSGIERVSRQAEWPDWNPPEQMIERQPYLPRFMAGGEGNPLGARALRQGDRTYRAGYATASGNHRRQSGNVEGLVLEVAKATNMVSCGAIAWFGSLALFLLGGAQLEGRSPNPIEIADHS